MQSSKKEGSSKRQRSTSRSTSPSPREPLPTWTHSPRKKKVVAATDDTITCAQRNIPAFLNKLYSMVDDTSTNELIRWSTEGTSFIVEQHELFSKTVLPRFYKHNTFSSFVRQLNMYDFHKVPHLQQGIMLVDSNQELWEFTHPNFQRNRHDLLHLVIRKRIRNNNDLQSQQQQVSPLPSSLEQQLLLPGQPFVNPTPTPTPTPATRLNTLGDTSMELEYVRLGSLVKDISTIRQHQHAISSDLQHLHNDNEILWRETLLAREKHQRHQQVIERILLFLTSVFSNDGKSGGDNIRLSMPQKQDEQQQISGNLDSIAAAAPSRLIEEAVQLAGISKIALQEKLFDHGIGTSSSSGVTMEDNASSLGATTNQAIPPMQQHQMATTTLQQQLDREQDIQEKGKTGMYRKMATDPSLLTLVLNDLYSLRDTFTSFSSNPHDLKSSSAINSNSSSRSEPLQQHPSYHNHPQQQQKQQQQHQQHHDYVPATGNSSMTMFHPNDQYDGMGRTAAPTTTYTNNHPTNTGMAPTGTNRLLGFPNLHTPPSVLTGLTNESPADGDGNITRIVGLAESLHTATRSAEAISQDIDDLQISIESLAATMGLDTNGTDGFDGYIDEFTDNYSNMISLATKNDKMQLFQLADDSKHEQPNSDNNDNNDNNSIDQKFTDIPPSNNA